MHCTRSITFDINNKHGDPVLQVKATEVNGSLVFELKVVGVGKKADLRALFFDVNDDAKLAGLGFLNADGTVTDFATGKVSDMGNGANINGFGGPFDVGMEFGTAGVGKDMVQTSTFTLTNTAGNLTLDDIAHVNFGTKIDGIQGPAKAVDLAPAAPNAVDDAYSIFEDGQAGLTSPSKVSQGVIFQVLDNDTDADGDTLIITDVEGAQHGVVTIVDGNDADLLVGDAVLYTPTLDYAGPDSFTYCISDNNGGTDFADVDVTIEAVADVPLLSYTIEAGASADQVIINVTATQNDADGSEFIQRIDVGALPDGVTITPIGIDPGGEPDQVVQQFMLTLPLGHDLSFDLSFTAVSEEESNGDQETGTLLIPIELDYNANFYEQTFLATDQSIWDTGDEFTFTDDRFIGIDTSFNESGGGFVFGSVEGSLKAGFQSKLTFEGGDVDASLTYDITVETNYNKTTDALLIGSSALLTDGGFNTVGPQGSYVLDFIFNYFFKAAAGLDFAVDDVELFSFQIGPSNNTLNILDVNSDDLLIEIPLPLGLSGTIEWPNLSTTGADSSPPPGEFSSNGASNNFFTLGLDVDQALADIFLGGVNPFDIGFDVGVAEGSIELADFDLSGGLNFLQAFILQETGLPGILHFEDGTSQAFIFGSDILLNNASDIDAAGNNNGTVDFTLELDPTATLSNNTDLGFNFGYSLELLKLSGSYDIGVDSGSFSLGPVVNIDDTIPIGTVDIYDNTFALNFDSQSVNFLA